ncbi:MAG: hypothetical protein KW793_02665 [Candidatus Doudnabacteria bacterium]|nr:hypothetical protein [Candidatus Doudnabacteria bacterium]
MEPNTLKDLKQGKICELCMRHDPMVKDYSEDFELQTAIRSYIEKETGETVNVNDIARLCDSCYFRVRDMSKDKEY